MFATRLLHGAFVGLVAMLLALFTLTAVMALGSPSAQRTAAQEAPASTLTNTASATKAKIGNFVAFTVRVENTGAETIPDFAVHLSLPDALNARVVDCPGGIATSVTNCHLGDFAAGSIRDVLFVVEVGSKEGNGPVTASASSMSLVIASAAVPPLKIVGPSRQ